MPSVCKYHQQINIQIACSFIECNLRDRALAVYYANRSHLHISSFLFNRMDVCRDCSYTIPIHHFIYVNNVFYTESKELLETSNSKLQWQFIWIEYSRGNILWFVWFYAAHIVQQTLNLSAHKYKHKINRIDDVHFGFCFVNIFRWHQRGYWICKALYANSTNWLCNFVYCWIIWFLTKCDG